MPIVPFTPGSAATRSKPQVPPDEPWALMAAAQMHSEGRLVESDAPEPKAPDERSR